MELERTGATTVAMLDPKLWEATRHSPKKLIQQCTLPTVDSHDTPEFRMERAMVEREKYYERNTWFQRIATEEDTTQVAYFCSEFAIHESMQQYSGGLESLPATTRAPSTSACRSWASAFSTDTATTFRNSRATGTPGCFIRVRLRGYADRGHGRRHPLPALGSRRRGAYLEDETTIGTPAARCGPRREQR